MRIVEQSQDRLVLEVRPVGLMIVCVGLFLLFLVLGFSMSAFLPAMVGLAGLPEAPGLGAMPSIPGMNLLGYASVLPLLVAVFLIKTRRATLDRASGKVVLASRGVFGHSETSYPLSALQVATLESNRSEEGGTTYRAVLRFSDQAGIVPLAPYFTSGSGPSRTVNAINAWLGPSSAPEGEAITLTGEQAAQALAALQKLGIVPPR